MEIKALFGTLSVIVTFIGYIPYFRDILRGRTKPHVFTWLVWSVVAWIIFAVQFTNNAGPGSWVAGFTAIATLVIFLLTLKSGEKHIVVADWLSLVFAAIALGLWFVTKDPLMSIILITLVDVVGGFFPTFRKSYNKPYEETISLYVMYALSWILSLAALEKYDLINMFSAIVFVGVNSALIAFLLVRRKHVKKGKPSRSRR